MRRTHLVVLVGVLAVLCVGVAGAHGNELVVGDQVSADGTVLVEHVSYIEDAYLVARTATGDGPGAPVGHRYLPTSGATFGERNLVSLDLHPDYWERRDPAASLWVVLHHEDGDDGFNVSEDPLIEQGDRPVGGRITVARGEGNVSVAAFDQETNATVTVRRVALASPGHLVVHRNATDGPAVGHVSLDAGVHTDVAVPLDGYVYNDETDSFEVVAVVHHDDGDAAFDESVDGPVRAGDAPVASGFVVTKAVPSVAVTPTATATPAPTTARTPAPTTQPLAETPTETATATPTPTAEPGTTRPAGDDPAETATAATGPATGPAATLVVVVLAAVVAVRRR